MDIGEIKKHKKQTLLIGYFGDDLPCDSCIERGGSRFKIMPQKIYLTITQLQKKPTTEPYTFAGYADVEKKYCFNCARSELKEKVKEVEGIYFELEGKDLLPKTEAPQPPEVFQCFKCYYQNTNKAEFRKWDGNYYCLDCLTKIGSVLATAKIK